MENIEVKVTGDKAVITIDLKKRLRASRTGQTTVVATSGGNQLIPGTQVKVGINAYVADGGASAPK